MSCHCSIDCFTVEIIQSFSSDSVQKLLTLLFSFITGIFLLFFLWVSYSLVTIFVVQPDNNHVPYLVPEHAKLVVNINGQEAFEELLQHLLLEGKGDEFIRKIKELARGNRFEKEYGINWARPVSYFESTYRDQPVRGFVVHISNASAWNKNINMFLGSTSVAKSDKNYGMVVQSKTLSKEELYQFIETCKQGSGKFVKPADTNPLITVHHTSAGKTSDIRFSAENNVLQTDGIIHHDGTLKPGTLNFVLTPADLHFTSDLITAELNDTLNKLIGSNLHFSGISMNYRGTTLSEANGTITPLPDADLVLGFEQATTIQQLVEHIPNAVWKETATSIQVGKQVYFVNQLNEKTIFLGTNKHAEINENRQSIGLILSGSLQPLVTIHGSRLILFALRMNPSFSLGMDFIRETQMCLITMTPMNATTYQFTGAVTFKNEKDALIGILELMAKRQL